MANLYTKFEVSSISRTGIARGVTFQNGSHDSDHAPFQVWFFFIWQSGTCYDQPVYQIWSYTKIWKAVQNVEIAVGLSSTVFEI